MVISNEEINDIIKIFKSLEEAALLIKSVVKSNWERRKRKKGGFIGIFSDTCYQVLG